MTPHSERPSTARVPRSQQDPETRMAKALAHPLRARILVRLNEQVASPNTLSKVLGEPLENVSYHVKALRDLGAVELVDAVPRRGALEHYYRATRGARLDDPAIRALPASIRSELSASTLTAAISDAAQAFKAGTLDSRADRHVSTTRLLLDEEAWAQLARDVEALVVRAHTLQQQATERRERDGTVEVAATVTVAFYQAAA